MKILKLICGLFKPKIVYYWYGRTKNPLENFGVKSFKNSKN
ncbi:MAG: hypothetical protein ACOC3X_03380 [Nanoarchaeota archaeon]